MAKSRLTAIGASFDYITIEDTVNTYERRAFEDGFVPLCDAPERADHFFGRIGRAIAEFAGGTGPNFFGKH